MRKSCQFVYYASFNASRLRKLCQHEVGVAVSGRLRQCSHVGRPRGIKKFAVDKLRSATPVRLSLLSTVEASPSKAVLLQYYRRLRTMCEPASYASHASHAMQAMAASHASQHASHTVISES